ncbi:MAG: hydroxyethylthiazole kinase, partial [Candidatus Geothermincolia bacterium]
MLSAGFGELLAALRDRKPLVHHITNFVVMNETANATLAIGASPVMAHAAEEVEEMVAMAGALVLNIGTLTPELIDSMVLAGKAANRHGVPVVLDPVGAGATKLRTDSAIRLLDEMRVAIIRGNASEVSTLAGVAAKTVGVDSGETASDPGRVAGDLARRRGCVVAITGEADTVSDGSRMARVLNGHALLGNVTGTGCMCTTMIGAFAAVCPVAQEAALAGLAAFGIAG